MMKPFLNKGSAHTSDVFYLIFCKSCSLQKVFKRMYCYYLCKQKTHYCDRKLRRVQVWIKSIQRDLFVFHSQQLIFCMYRVFARRVYTFATKIYQFFMKQIWPQMALFYSKFCQLSEYAHFLKLRRSQNASGLSNQDLVDFALAHTKFIL